MTIPQILTQLVARAAEAAGHGDSPVPLEPAVASNNPQHGDYQSNYAFRLGKALRTNPRAVAEQIAAAMPDHPAVAAVEVAGPGFLNFRLDEGWLGAQLAAQCADPRFGLDKREGAVVIDYSSPNVAKRMHVGHLRSTVIGNALDRLYRFAGYDVVADNHIGDWGTQFGKLIVAWERWVDHAAYAEDPIAELQRIYQAFHEAAREDPTLEDLARAETVKLQAGDEASRALWEDFVEKSLIEYQQVYDRLGITFDETLGESAYDELLAPLVDGLLESGVAQLSEGAVVIPFEGSDGKGLTKNPLLIRKSDGAFLYGTTDMATVRYRLDRWAPVKIIYVTDMRQQLHFRQFFAACKKLGWVAEGQLEHVWFGMLTIAGEAASTREGTVINLVDLLDESVRHAREKVEALSAERPLDPPLTDEEMAHIAEKVGVGAIRYSDISQNPQSGLTFEWEKMLSLEGNTAPFLMYSYARARSIQRRGGVEAPAIGAVALGEPTERALALNLARFPEAVSLAMETSRPNVLCDYLYNLARDFNRFFQECPVLKSEGAVRESRLSLVEASARVLEAGLQLAGLTPLERM